MSNTNTIFGWVLASGIVALGLNSVSDKLFASEVEEFGYVIEAPEEGAAADSGPDFATLLANGSAAAGEAVFAKCTACHTIEQGGANGIGPNLYGVLGTGIGEHAPGFAYSSALADKGGTWDYAAMDAWLASPRAFANGTKMSFAGLSSAEDRANVVLYMREYGGGPALPEPVAAVDVEGELDGAGEGPGQTEGAPADSNEAAGAMGAEQPVPEDAAATNTGSPN
ncbi:c-type cytochrome [Aurantiacibacter odishensis]|uniref:c-type cytochrome n=1 Tax=Aurantiacibacter odishensis TaxID=1155476 RepID=UPI000E7137C7|nr:cytochrome c family protein [Aurantiacibacter odishensis]